MAAALGGPLANYNHVILKDAHCLATVNTVKDGSPRALLRDISKVLLDSLMALEAAKKKGYCAEESLLQWCSYLQDGLAGHSYMPCLNDWCPANHDLKPVLLNK